MPYQKTIVSLAKKRVPCLPVPPDVDILKIKRSLNLESNEPLPRCRGKMNSKVRKFEKQGDFSHSGSPRTHLCEQCRCKHTAGWGTTHYGVGYCWHHDFDGARLFAKSQAIALRQGYPLDPITYKSDSEYINDVRKQAEDSGSVLSLRDDLVLLRTHLQEFELFWREADPSKQLRMKTAQGAAPMTDDVKIACLAKLAGAISRLSRDQYTISEQDYVSIDEVKTWLWAIIQSLERNHRKLMSGELEAKDFLAAMMGDLREIPQPKAGRRKK